MIAGYASVAVETQLSQAEAAALAKPATAGLFPLREPPRRYGGDRRASLKRQKPRWGKPGFRKRTIGVGGHPVEIVLLSKRDGIGGVPQTSDENCDRLPQPHEPLGQISVGDRAVSAFVNRLTRRLSSLSPQHRG